jgi:alanine dehydrogenase
MTRPFRYVPNHVVKQLLTPAQANEIAEQTLVDHHNGDIDWADPRQLDLFPALEGTQYKVKGCVLRRHAVAGFRVVGLNRKEGGEAIMAERPTKNVLLSDARTAAFFGIVDERWSYGIRTGACGAVALKHLAAPGADECGMVATGHMAYGALLTLAAAVPLKRVRVWSRSAERRANFAKRIADELGIEVVAAETAEECVRGAGLVITATNAEKPFLQKDWFAPGVTIYAMGGFQEIETRAYSEMTFMVDDRDQVKICKDIMYLTAEHGYSDEWVSADLPEVVAGAHPGRSSDDEQILIRSQGLVTQDVAQAFWLYEEAERRDLGVRLEDHLVEVPGTPLY